jgi:hypothetical protein
LPRALPERDRARSAWRATSGVAATDQEIE